MKFTELKTIQDQNFQDKTVLLRVDFNVPINSQKEIQDNSRIKSSLPTIKFLLKQKAKIILISHYGRPQQEKRISLRFLIPELEKQFTKLLGKKYSILFIKNFQSEAGQRRIQKADQNQIILLENIRFFEEEEKNEPKLAKALASLGEVYINDAFSVLHRKHASVYQISKLLPAYAGKSLSEEFNKLNQVFNHQKINFKSKTLIIGGAKIDTKIGIIQNFINQYQNILIGGALANTLLKSQKIEIGKSLFQKNKIQVTKNLIKKIKNSKSKLFLPNDLKVQNKIKSQSLNQINQDDKILDLGNQTIKNFTKIIEKSKLIIWNGPLGYYENPDFRIATKKIAQAIAAATANNQAISIVGGGDTIDSIKKSKIALNKFTHVSTAGGAMLEFLEGKDLPGLKYLIKKNQ